LIHDGAMERPAAAPSESVLHRLVHALDGIPDGLVAAYRDAFADRRLAWASPAVFTVGSYVGFYGLGLVLVRPSDQHAALVFAVLVGLIGILAGLGLGWKAVGRPPRLRSVDRPVLRTYGLLLLFVGLAALVAYFLVIGYIPLFQPSLEQARVDAAEEGGAPLRVLSLLALPGAWILVADAVAHRDRRGFVVAVVAVAVVALGFTLTGNRSPAFQAVEVALVAGLLAAGKDRIGGRGVALLTAVGIVFVLGAGLFGAFRLASNDVYGPPVPGAPERPPDYGKLTAIAITGYLVVPINNLGYTLDAVPDRIGWRYGLTYLQPALTVLPGKQTTFDADLKAALDQRYAGGGTVPGLLGEAYANFGAVGWLVIPFIVGTAIMALYRCRQGVTPEMATLYGFAIVHVSIGGVLSGLSMASIFPLEAYAVLGFGVLGLPSVGNWIDRDRARRTA
jgi:hypothetical protein